MLLHLAQSLGLKEGSQHPHLNQESLSDFLASHFRMGFEKQGIPWETGFEHSNLISSSRQRSGYIYAWDTLHEAEGLP